MGGNAGGSTTSKTEIPGFLKDAAVGLLDRALAQSRTGYMPYAGPVEPGLTNAHHAARGNMNDAAAAFGMRGVESSLPAAQNYGGMWGFSSMPLYEQQMGWMEANRPGQLEHHQQFTVDPVTGQPRPGSMLEAQQVQPVPQSEPIPRYTLPRDDPRYNFYGGVVGGANPRQDPGPAGGMAGSPMGGSPMGGGYTGLGDMFDGGGPGQSGDTFQGGGLLSALANASRFSPR